MAVLVSLFPSRGAAQLDDARKSIAEKTKKAMEHYDRLDYDNAKRLLAEAIKLAAENQLADDPVAARSYLALGILYFSGLNDVESAKVAFGRALAIDPEIAVDPAYRTGEMEHLLARVREERIGAPLPLAGEAGWDVLDCAAVVGIHHPHAETAEAGRGRTLVTQVSPDLKPVKVVLHYRPEGVAEFSELLMATHPDCLYSATIPPAAVRGDFLHYYITAASDLGKVIATHGTSASPNIIEIVDETRIGVGGHDAENPLAAQPGGKGDLAARRRARAQGLFVSMAIGTGGAYVSGATELLGYQVGCCFAPALFHFFPEVGYYVRPKMSLSAAFRLGFPVGANLAGHASVAPAALVRLRRFLFSRREGVQLSATIGGGIIRQAVKLGENAPGVRPGADTDTTATGPLFVGGGAAYVRSLPQRLQIVFPGTAQIVAELHTIAGIPVVATLGPCVPGTSCARLSFAVEFDSNLGLLVTF